MSTVIVSVVIALSAGGEKMASSEIKKLESRIAALEQRLPDGVQPIFRFSLATGRDDWGHFEDDKNTLVGIEINKLPCGAYWMRTYRQRYRWDGADRAMPAAGDWFWTSWMLVEVEANLSRRQLTKDWNIRERTEEYEKNPNKTRIVGFYKLDVPDVASPKIKYELVPISQPDSDGK